MLDPMSLDKAKVDAWRATHSYDMEYLSLSDEEVLIILKKEEKDAFAAKRFEALFGSATAESASTPRHPPKGYEVTRLAEWERFLSEVFRLKIDVKNLPVADSKPGLDFLIVVPRELTLARIVQVMRVFVPIKSSLDFSKVRSLRRDLGSYTVYASSDTEPNESMKGISAKTVIASGISPMNIEERLLMDIYLTWKVKSSVLDLNCDTLCAGSIDERQNAIKVQRTDDGLSIVACPYDLEDDDAAIREVVG